MESESNEALAQKLSALLNSPDSMERIRSAMSAFGMEEPPKAAEPTASPAPSAADAAPKAGLDLGNLGALASMLPLLNGMRSDDQNTALLRSLRPYLHGDREKKLDDAIKMMQFMKMVPALKDKGLF